MSENLGSTVFWGTSIGLSLVLAPHTPLWLVPAAGFAAHTVYDMDREGWHNQYQRLLAGQPWQQLPAAGRQLAQRVLPHQAEQHAQPAPAPAHDLFSTLVEPPHRLIIGHTGGGKTTLIHSLAVNWAASGHQVVVLDPDAAPGQWPGCKAVGHGDNYEAIAHGLTIVGREITRRRTARANGERRFKPVHIIIDECQDVIAEVPGAMHVIESLARRGRKIAMHLTLGVQDKQAGTLKLDGKTHLLRNLQTVDVCQQDGQRVALVHRPDGTVTMPIPTLIDPEEFILHKQPAAIPAPVMTHHDDLLLHTLLNQAVPNESVTSALGRASNASGVTVTVTDTSSNGNGNGQRTESVTSASGRDKHEVTVTVNAHAEVSPVSTGGRRRRSRQGPDIKARVARDKLARLAAAYRESGAAGESFRAAYERLGGSRNQMLAAWQAGKATKGKKTDA